VSGKTVVRDARRWWVVGCDGSMLHFYEAPTSRSAVAAFRANLVEMERGSGVSIRDAQFIVRGLQPHVVEGPLTTQQAYELDLGWTWAICWADGFHGTSVSPVGPIDRATAASRLGEQTTARLERSARVRYGLDLIGGKAA
jgi:hypothetical protein